MSRYAGMSHFNATQETIMSSRRNGFDGISQLYKDLSLSSGLPTTDETSRLAAIEDLKACDASRLETTALLTREAFYAFEHPAIELKALNELTRTNPTGIAPILFGLCQRGIGFESFKVCINYLKENEKDLAIATLIHNSQRNFKRYSAEQLNELGYNDHKPQATQVDRLTQFIADVFSEPDPELLGLKLGTLAFEAASKSPEIAVPVFYTMLSERKDTTVRLLALDFMERMCLITNTPESRSFLTRVLREYKDDPDLNFSVNMKAARLVLTDEQSS